MVDITAKTATARIAHAQVICFFQLVIDNELPSGVLIIIKILATQAFVELPIAAFNLIQSSKESQEKNVEIYSAKGPVFSTAIIAGKR